MTDEKTLIARRYAEMEEHRQRMLNEYHRKQLDNLNNTVPPLSYDPRRYDKTGEEYERLAREQKEVELKHVLEQMRNLEIQRRAEEEKRMRGQAYVMYNVGYHDSLISFILDSNKHEDSSHAIIERFKRAYHLGQLDRQSHMPQRWTVDTEPGNGEIMRTADAVLSLLGDDDAQSDETA